MYLVDLLPSTDHRILLAISGPNPSKAQEALLQCTLATEPGCFFKKVLKKTSITLRAMAVIL